MFLIIQINIIFKAIKKYHCITKCIRENSVKLIRFQLAKVTKISKLSKRAIKITKKFKKLYSQKFRDHIVSMRKLKMIVRSILSA